MILQIGFCFHYFSFPKKTFITFSETISTVFFPEVGLILEDFLCIFKFLIFNYYFQVLHLHSLLLCNKLAQHLVALNSYLFCSQFCGVGSHGGLTRPLVSVLSGISRGSRSCRAHFQDGFFTHFDATLSLRGLSMWFGLHTAWKSQQSHPSFPLAVFQKTGSGPCQAS